MNTKLMIFFLFIIILVSMGGVWWFLNNEEYVQRRDDLIQKKEQIQRQIENAANITKELEEKERQLSQAKEDLAFWKKKIAEKADIPRTLRDIEEIALDYKVKFNEIRIESIAPYEGYSEIPIELYIIGPFHDVGRFMRKLEHSKLFNVNGGTLTLQPYVGKRASNQPEINMTLKVKLYILNLGGGGFND
jgi:type IV pilus assembly protein PilO